MTVSDSGQTNFRSSQNPLRRTVLAQRAVRRARAAMKPVHAESAQFRAANQHNSGVTSSFIFSEPARSSELTYVEWLREQMVCSRWTKFLVTFYLHWFVLLCLAIVYMRNPEQFTSLKIDAFFSEYAPLDDSLIATGEVAFELSDDESGGLDWGTAPELSAMSASTMTPGFNIDSLDLVPDGFAALSGGMPVSGSSENMKPGQGQGHGQGRGNGRGDGTGGRPGYAVSAGSFSVWTEPKNPDPGEPYKIIIQIRLPDGTERYSVADLDGVVVGSDGYQKLVPGTVRGFLPIQDGQVKFEVHIVSADQDVEDTVFIRSKLLREAQRLRIQF